MPMMASSEYRTYLADMDIAWEISKCLGSGMLGVRNIGNCHGKKMSGVLK